MKISRNNIDKLLDGLLCLINDKLNTLQKNIPKHTANNIITCKLKSNIEYCSMRYESVVKPVRKANET